MNEWMIAAAIMYAFNALYGFLFIWVALRSGVEKERDHKVVQIPTPFKTTTTEEWETYPAGETTTYPAGGETVCGDHPRPDSDGAL